MNKRKKSKHHHGQRINGVFFDPSKRVLSLKRKEYKIEVSLGSFKRFFIKYRRLVVISALLVISAVGIVTYKSVTHADVTSLYPQSCLGGWVNPGNAQGKPDVSSNATADAFTETNSAILGDSNAQIYCGNFTGEAPADTVPTHLIVKLSWVLNSTSQTQTGTSTALVITSQDTVASSTQAALEATTTEGDLSHYTIIITDAPTTTPEISGPSPSLPVNNEPTTEKTVPPSSESSAPAATESPVSFLHKLIPIAHAESAQDLFSISYSLDGIEWKELGNISRETIQNAQLEVPITSISNWDDLKKMQISIERIVPANDTPTLYLDGMWLEADYGPGTELAIKPEAGKLHFDDIQNDKSKLPLVIKKVEGNETLVVSKFSGTIGGLAIYNSNGTLILTTHVDADAYSIPATYFGIGNFVIIRTRDPNLCVAKSMAECLESKADSGDNSFTISMGTSTPVSDISTTSPQSL
jgi:hypothetical protein